MQRASLLFVFGLTFFSRVLSQAPTPAPPLTPVQLARLHAIKVWDIEFSYSKADHRSAQRDISGYSFGGKPIDHFNISWQRDNAYTFTISVGGKTRQSDCAAGSDSCLTKYQFPSAITDASETFDRFDEVHFSDGCILEGGGTGPGFQNLHTGFSVSGGKVLNGTGTNTARGRFTINYDVNPPVAKASFYSSGIPYNAVLDYEGCYRSDNADYSGVSSQFIIDIHPFDINYDNSGDTQIRFENGAFVIQGSSTYTMMFDVCGGAWLPCDNNTTVPNAGIITITYDWAVRSRPDSSITILRPAEGDLFVSGETDTIRWMTDASDTLRILYSIDSGKTYTEIADSIPAADELYSWKVPDALSRKCMIRIESMTDTSRHAVSKLFRMKGYVLTRITTEGNYEAFLPSSHAWADPNTTPVWWPESWWQQFDYVSGNDPYTNELYPPSLFRSSSSSTFPDWPLFVRTFGFDTCYTTFNFSGDSTDYRYSTWFTWAQLSRDHVGSCEGMAVSSVAAFGNPSTFLDRFPEFGSFSTIGSLYVNDTYRRVVNQLWLMQHSATVKANERLPYNRIPNEAWIDTLKKIFLDENRTRDVALGLFGRGGHSMTPYKITKDSTIIPEPYYLIWVYDPNRPVDNDAKILLRTSDGFWRFPAELSTAEFINYGHGLTLNPFMLYLGDITFEYPRAGRRREPLAQGTAPPLKILTTTNAEIIITSGAGDSAGYADSVAFSTIPGVTPIQLKTGYFLPPIGYEVEDDSGSYEILLRNLTTAEPHVAILRDSFIMDYERADAQPTEFDRIRIHDNQFELSNPDVASKTVNLRAIAIAPGEDRVTRFLDYTLSPSDATLLSNGDGGSTKIRHNGKGTSYRLELIVSRNGGSGASFRSEIIPMDPNATHELVANWNDLSEPAIVRIDLGSDGSIDDSLIVQNLSGVPDNQSTGLPKQFYLSQNFPNPFNPVTRIEYGLPTGAYVEVRINDVLGRIVATLVEEQQNAGFKAVTWDASSQPSGTYFCNIRVFDAVRSSELIFSETRKLLLVR